MELPDSINYGTHTLPERFWTINKEEHQKNVAIRVFNRAIKRQRRRQRTGR